MSQLLLQITTGFLALIPIVNGVITMLGVNDPLYRPHGSIGREMMTQEVALERLGSENPPTLVEEPGLGERAYWATTAQSAAYMVLRGSTLLGIGLPPGVKNSESSRPTLRKAVQNALGCI